MPDYHFTGTYPRVLVGLAQGVNASLTPAAGEPPVNGSTLEASYGDAVHTDEPYPHPELELVGGAQPVDAAPAPEPVVPIQLVAADAPAPDPAPDAMTSEGSPAPAEPTA